MNSNPFIRQITNTHAIPCLIVSFVAECSFLRKGEERGYTAVINAKVRTIIPDREILDLYPLKSVTGQNKRFGGFARFVAKRLNQIRQIKVRLPGDTALLNAQELLKENIGGIKL